ncbi:MAG: hypothetical protein ACI9TF_001824 [Paracrocinitomix sp.]|jgi:hypothetical protein
MVEFAIISVALFTLIFGIIEGGFAVQARSAVNNAVDDAARRGAVAGTSADADYLIIRQLIGRGAEAADIDYVVVYRADNGSSPVPPGCIDGIAAPGVCNVYRPNIVSGKFNLDPGAYGCPSGLGTQWCPANRANGDEIGFLGVYVRANYEPIINQIFFEFDFRVDANSLQAIETSGEL